MKVDINKTHRKPFVQYPLTKSIGSTTNNQTFTNYKIIKPFNSSEKKQPTSMGKLDIMDNKYFN